VRAFGGGLALASHNPKPERTPSQYCPDSSGRNLKATYFQYKFQKRLTPSMLDDKKI